MGMQRRQLLKALGLAPLYGLLQPPPRARAQAVAPPRVVFFVQPHGHVPSAWNMPIVGAARESYATRSLRELPVDAFSEVLRPLHAFRDRLLVIEGLSNTSVLADRAQVLRSGGDDNNHSLAVAGLLTGARALQRSGVPCTGGARSLDQELGIRLAGPGRFATRVYGADYRPNQGVAPFSFIGPGQPAPMVSDPRAAFLDLMGTLAPDSKSVTRADLLRSLRGSVLDTVAGEYAALSARLGANDRKKLDSHRALIRDLERTLSVGVTAHCDRSFDASADSVTSFMRLTRMALSCDLTRVITYVAPVPECSAFGYPADAHVHLTYAHASVADSASCGQTYTPLAERAMTDLGSWYARHFAALLRELDAVPEGDGTLLDHTTVVWLTELATPTHQHNDTFALVAGGGSNKLRLGRYVRFPRALQNPMANSPATGPALNRFLVTLMQALGQPDQSFGMTEASGAAGQRVPMTGALPELFS